MKKLEDAIAAVVEGSLADLPAVIASSRADLYAAASSLTPLSVSCAALLRVLNDWQTGRFSDVDVQQWASFVRRGYVAGRNDGPMPTIDIDYDERDEDLIIEIIGRFDELGDLIDGTIGHEERQEMREALECALA